MTPAPPPARDPRMERGGSDEGGGWTLMLLPRGGEGGVRQYALTVAQVRRWRLTGGVAVLLVLALVLGTGLMLPRSAAYDDLLAENLVLKERLQAIDRKMAEVDRILLRLRLYDAQLESLGEARGDHGPLPPETWSNRALDGAQLPHEELLLHDGDGAALVDDPLDEVPLEGLPLDDEQLDQLVEGGLAELGLDPTVQLPLRQRLEAPGASGVDDQVRPAESWAEGVEARAETFLALFAEAEPNLNLFMEELEELRALEASLPSTWPADGFLSSGFGWRRHPLGIRWRFHSGIDMAGDRGDPIVAAAGGTVVRAEYNAGYGRMVEIEHGFGITTLYAHCHRLHVREGQVVGRGDHIADVGSTGMSTGPHLHFEVRLDGHAVDPMHYLGR